VEARTKRLATSIAVFLTVTGSVALVATFLYASRDPLWERHLIDNLILYWASLVAALPWYYLVEDKPGRSWRDWIPVPLSLVTGGSAFCIIFDLQRGRPWSHTLSELPEPIHWIMVVAAIVSAFLLIRERTPSDRNRRAPKKEDVA
jgi:hypothetical protein